MKDRVMTPWPPITAQRVLLLMGIFESALLGFLIIDHQAWALLLLIVTGMPIALQVAARIPFESLLAATVLITCALYRGVIFASQVQIGPVVITPLDLLWMYTAIRYFWYARIERKQMPAMYLMLTVTFVTAISGLLWSQPLYNIMKLLRTEFFFAVAIGFGGALGLEATVKILRAIVIGGSLTAIQQLVTFGFASAGIRLWAYLNIAADEGTDPQIYNPNLTSSFRDNGVVINLSVFAIVILLAFVGAERPLFNRMTTATLLVLCVSGVILSLTRSNWIALFLGLLIWVLITRGMNLRRVSIVGLISTLVIVSILLAGESSRMSSIGELLSARLNNIQTGAEVNTMADRLNETRVAIGEVGKSAILGVGAADIDVVAISNDQVVHEVRNQLHNGYAQYLVGGGIFGLLSIVLLLATGAVRSWHLSRRQAGSIHAAVSRAVFLTLAMTSILSISTGTINDFQQASVIGVVLGIALSPIARVPYSSSIAHQQVVGRQPLSPQGTLS